MTTSPEGSDQVALEPPSEVTEALPPSGEETSLTVLDPTTGEVLDLSSPNETLGAWLSEAREWKSRLGEAVRMVEAELNRRMDTDCSWTLHAEGMDIQGSAPGRTTYDAEELDAGLAVLEEKKLISPKARRAAVEQVTTLKLRKSGVNALLKIEGEVSELVRSLEKPDPKPRRVSVKVKP